MFLMRGSPARANLPATLRNRAGAVTRIATPINVVDRHDRIRAELLDETRDAGVRTLLDRQACPLNIERPRLMPALL
jgi:hypothetical protein